MKEFRLRCMDAADPVQLYLLGIAWDPGPDGGLLGWAAIISLVLTGAFQFILIGLLANQADLGTSP